MPLYDYKCPACGSVQEVLQRAEDRAQVSCSQCSKPMQRQVSAPVFKLKGGGWYETDFKSPKKSDSRNDKDDTSAGKQSATGEKPAAAAASSQAGDSGTSSATDSASGSP